MLHQKTAIASHSILAPVAGRPGRAMARKRSRKVPLRAAAGTQVGSARKARRVTSAFHRLSRELEAAHQAGDRAKAETLRVALEERRREYQDASIFATAQFRTSRWVLRVLRAMDALPRRDEPRLEALEIGAINTQLTSSQYLHTRAVDLRSRHPAIEEVDFFRLCPPARSLDLVVCAMVLNCLPAPGLRGEMLRRVRTLLVDGGLLFLALPRQCLTRSPFTDHAHFMSALRALGLGPVAQKQTPKVALFCCRRCARPSAPAAAAATAIESPERPLQRGGRPGHPALARAEASHEAAGTAAEAMLDARDPDLGSWCPTWARREQRVEEEGDDALRRTFPHPPPVQREGTALSNRFSFSFQEPAELAPLLP